MYKFQEKQATGSTVIWEYTHNDYLIILMKGMKVKTYNSWHKKLQSYNLRVLHHENICNCWLAKHVSIFYKYETQFAGQQLQKLWGHKNIFLWLHPVYINNMYIHVNYFQGNMFRTPSLSQTSLFLKDIHAILFHTSHCVHHCFIIPKFHIIWTEAKNLLGTSASLRTFGSLTLLTKKIRYDDVRTATPVPLRLVNILASINFVSFASCKNNHIWKITPCSFKMHNDKNKFHVTPNYLISY